MEDGLRGHRVKPASISKIRAITAQVRTLLHLGSGKINMSHVIERVLPTLIPEFYFDVLEPHEMGVDEARTYPDKDFMEIRSDVYDALCDGDGRAQFTLAHELGHLVMHRGIQSTASFTRNVRSNSHKVYEDSEWQADTFASELLMPYDKVVSCKSSEEIRVLFGVSAQAAGVRYRKVN